LTVDRLLYNLGVIGKSGTIKKVLEKASRSLHLNSLNLYLNLRDMQRVCVRKTGSAAAFYRTCAGPATSATAVAS
jgi:hypothetical protein